MTDLDYRKAARDLQIDIFAADYYVNRYARCVEGNGLSYDSIVEMKHPAHELMPMLNDFWNSLPDAPHIRVQPFFLLCDLCAEDVYDENPQ